MQHFKLQQQDDGDEHFEVREEIDAERSEHEEGVEIDSAEVGAKAPTLAQTVGVRDIGVERRPHQVDAHAHDPRMGSPIAARRGVPAFMQRRREDDQNEHDQEEHRLVDQVAQALRDAMHKEQPPVEGDEAGQGRHDDERPEPGSEDGGDRIHKRRWDDGCLEVQGK